MSSNYARTAALAAGQQGRVAWWQLTDAGIDRHAIQRWLADGRLHRVHHGVYAVGHAAPSVHGDYMAAVLACRKGAILSHRAAAYLVRLLRNAPAPVPEVTVPTTAGRRRDGIVIHRVRALHPLDTTTADDIPIATVPRILLDLAVATPPQQLTRICHEAWVHHRVGPRQVEACIARNPTKKGAARLRHALGSDVTLSTLESGFVALLRTRGLPLPRTNIDRRGDKVDCHWPDLDLTIELLSYRFHARGRPSRTTSPAAAAAPTSASRTATSSSAARPRSRRSAACCSTAPPRPEPARGPAFCNVACSTRQPKTGAMTVGAQCPAAPRKRATGDPHGTAAATFWGRV